MLVATMPSTAAHDPRGYTMRAKKEGAECIEVRTDLMEHLPAFDSALPLLLSLRTTDFSLLERLTITYVDCDVLHPAFSVLTPKKGTKFIASFHDKEKTPSLSDLKKIVQKMYTKKPWMIKVATVIEDYKDMSVLLALQEYLNKKSIRNTVLGMGPKAHLLRSLSPLRNEFTYTYLKDDLPAAPGQLPIAFYSLLKHRKKPKLFGILGGPQVSSSLSPIIHNALFSRYKIDAIYSAFPSEEFSPAFKELKKLGLAGLSVTAPFKHEAYKASTKRSPLASSLGVANTLLLSGASVSADNTDVAGILEGYPELTGAKQVAIFGAGGAAAAAVGAVRKVCPKAALTVFVRDTVKAAKEPSMKGVTLQSLGGAQMTSADALLFAVSQDVSFPLPKPANSSAIAIDLRYGFSSAFLKDAAALGYKTYDGLPMLLHQALHQFQLFTGKTPRKDDAEYLASVLSSFL